MHGSVRARKRTKLLPDMFSNDCWTCAQTEEGIICPIYSFVCRFVVLVSCEIFVIENNGVQRRGVTHARGMYHCAA